MSALAIVLIVLGGLLLLLLVGGFVANRRHFEAEKDALRLQIEEANERLARAHAEDRGWDRATMEAAARQALAASGETPERLELVQVIDRPGTDDDKAVFRAEGREVVIERSGDRWAAAS